MNCYTGIITTLGPSSMDQKMLRKMAQRGMNVARMNFSHGDHEQHKRIIELIRSNNKKHDFNVALLQDLEGYRIRVGAFKGVKKLIKGRIVYFAFGKESADDDIPFDYDGDPKVIPIGTNVFIDDGTLHLKVTGYSRDRLKLKVIQGGDLKSRKGINIPGLKLKGNILTEKDKNDLEFGVRHNVDIICQSFVRNRKDIQRVIDAVDGRLPGCKFLAKIECQEGVENIDSILDVCDGVIVARGDLGVSIPLYKVPIVQKYLIRHCNRKKKIAVIATQMLDSMIENGRPTRAEVSDVANAIIDGADYVMLSGETAVGRYPSRSVLNMEQIIEYTERYMWIKPR